MQASCCKHPIAYKFRPHACVRPSPVRVRSSGVSPQQLQQQASPRHTATSTMSATAAAWRQQASATVERARKQDVNQAFAVAGKIADVPFEMVTALQVTGLPGIMQLPLAPHQVEGLLKLSAPAPFGLNADTILDPAVRKAQQIDAACVTAREVWQKQLEKLTSKVAKELGVDKHVTVEARPYKLLMYTEGGHFKAHKDTEKEAGMFGTLVLQLPVIGGHKGGDLVFNHHGKTFQWATEASSDDLSFQYAAFYADVEHELQPITSGTRVVMVYNLVRTAGDEMPAALDGSPLIKELNTAISCWEEDLAAGKPNTPHYLCVPLNHQYTESSLSFSALKGSDVKMVGCLSYPGSGLDVHLALFTKKETYGDGTMGDSGFLGDEYSVLGCLSAVGTKLSEDVLRHLKLYHDKKKRVPLPELLGGGVVEAWDDEDDDEEEDEDDWEIECEETDNDSSEDDTERAARKKRKPNNGSGSEGEDSEMKDAARRRRKPNKIEKHPWTGNEGACFDKIYHDTVAIIWPKGQSGVVLGDGLASALYQLQLRQAQKDTAGVVSLVQDIATLFQTPLAPKPEDRGYTYPQPPKYQHLGNDHDLLSVLRAVSLLDTVTAVTALASIIAHIPTVGGIAHNWQDYDIEKDDMEFHNMKEDDAEDEYLSSDNIKSGDKLRYAIVDSIIKHGTPKELVAAATELVNAHAVTSTTACIRLVLRAASKSVELGAAMADAVLSQTLLAADAQQIITGMKPYDVCNLAVMLGKLSTHHHHMDALATTILALSDPQPVLEVLARAPAVRNTAHNVPAPFKLLAQARQQHMQQFVKPDPEFTWEMKEATFPAHPDVEAFLRGSDEKATFNFFQSHWEASNWASKHFGSTEHFKKDWASYINKKKPTFTARAQATRGSGPQSVIVTKTRSYYEYHLGLHRAEQKTIKDHLAHAEQLLQACGKA